MDPEVIILEPWVVPLLAGTVTPVLTGIVTRFTASPATKALTGVVLAALASALLEIFKVVSSDAGFEIRDAAVMFVVVFAAHVVSYYGLWRPIGDGGAPGARQTKGWVG